MVLAVAAGLSGKKSPWRGQWKPTLLLLLAALLAKKHSRAPRAAIRAPVATHAGPSALEVPVKATRAA